MCLFYVGENIVRIYLISKCKNIYWHALPNIDKIEDGLTFIFKKVAKCE